MSVSWNGVRRNLARGLENLRWMAGFFAERVRKETHLARAAYQVRRLEEHMEEACLSAGRRLFAVRHVENPLADPELAELLREIERIGRELDEHAEQVHAMQGNFAGTEGGDEETSEPGPE